MQFSLQLMAQSSDVSSPSTKRSWSMYSSERKWSGAVVQVWKLPFPFLHFAGAGIRQLTDEIQKFFDARP
jgi:hypothetical protein